MYDHMEIMSNLIFSEGKALCGKVQPSILRDNAYEKIKFMSKCDKIKLYISAGIRDIIVRETEKNYGKI